MPKEEVVAALIAFIREKFLDGDRPGELTDESPLLEWGVLDSLNTAVLLKFIRDDLGVEVSPAYVDAVHFRDVRSIADLVVSTPIAGAAR
jgi:acyl carrier protein